MLIFTPFRRLNEVARVTLFCYLPTESHEQLH